MYSHPSHPQYKGVGSSPHTDPPFLGGADVYMWRNDAGLSRACQACACPCFNCICLRLFEFRKCSQVLPAARCHQMLQHATRCYNMLPGATICYNILQYATIYYKMLQHVTILYKIQTRANIKDRWAQRKPIYNIFIIWWHLVASCSILKYVVALCCIVYYVVAYCSIL